MFETVFTRRRHPFRVAVWLGIAVFVVLEHWNWCQDGWCYDYGWPYTYFNWSDARPLPGFESTEGFHLLPLVADAAVAVAITLAIVGLVYFAGRWFRRGAAVGT